eukprot:m.473628 g.473628  ORF g.473628 m.473628 type:complete len:312 (-) comp21664_c0_seq45:4485-5420(-)
MSQARLIFGVAIAGFCTSINVATHTESQECSNPFDLRGIESHNHDEIATAVHVDSTAQLWSTPFVVGNLADLHLIANLRQLVLDTREVDATGELKSNRAGGGWHSKDYIHANSHVFSAEHVEVHCKSLLELIEHILGQAAPILSNAVSKSNLFVQNMWGGINANGQYNTVHTHPNAVLSGVLHLDSGDGDRGDIIFFDPRIATGCSNKTDSDREALSMQCRDYCRTHEKDLLESKIRCWTSEPPWSPSTCNFFVVDKHLSIAYFYHSLLVFSQDISEWRPQNYFEQSTRHYMVLKRAIDPGYLFLFCKEYS